MPDKLKTTNIKGKPYVEVNERIRWLRENYPHATLLTEIISNEGNTVIMKATLVIDEKIISTGHAMEVKGDGMVNKTSHLENAETSAWGRCLAGAGIGVTDSIASAEEVANAIAQQEAPEREKAKVAADAYPQGKDNIQKALDALRKAFAEKDYEKADEIKAWAEANDAAQVYDLHEQLFKQK